MFNTVCPTCNKRDIVIDNGCAVCLFLRSDEEQERFKRIVGKIFEEIPEALGYSRENQANMVYRAMPYICTYKAQHRAEIRYFATKAIEDAIEEHTVEACPETLKMWSAA